MIHPNETARRGDNIDLHESHDRKIAATTSDRGRRNGAAGQGAGNTHVRPARRPQSLSPTERAPGMSLPRAGSTRVSTSADQNANSTRQGCNRLTCKPGRRCAEHRPGAQPVHISTVIAQLKQRWGVA